MKTGFFQKKITTITLLLCMGLLFCFQLNAATASKKTYTTPAGYWQTIDHNTKKASSVIKIWKGKDGLYYGRIHYIYPEDGHMKNDVCKKCKGALHNKPILGMQIINHFKATEDANFYNDGRIMDPTNGKTYKCHLTLKQNGNVLDVHGYIGIPLFGRSDMWYRVHPKAQAN